jgi:hypothetical protein
MMLGVIMGLVILGAAALQAQLAEQAAVLATLLLPHVCSEAVSVFLKSPKVRFQQPKYSLGIQCVHARCP